MQLLIGTRTGRQQHSGTSAATGGIHLGGGAPGTWL